MSTAQMAAQRFYNKGTGKMEAPHAGFNFHPVPAGHQMAKTNHVVTTHPAPAPKPAIDLAHMNDQQRLAFAQKLVGQELSAGRLPFQQNEQQLAGRETATRENVERLAGQGNQLGTQLVAGQKASGEAGEQRAREAATQAQIPQGPAEPPSRQDALLKALGQGGINAAANSRAAGEKWAQSQQSAYQQEGTAAIQNVGTRIGAERLKNRNNEAAYLAKGEGATTKLFTELTGEHDKLAAAEAATKLRREELFGKERQNKAKNELTEQGHRVTLHGQGVTAQSAKEAREQSAHEGAANRQQAENASKRTAATATAGRKQRLEEKHEKETKQKPTKEQSGVLKELADTYTAFEAYVRNRKVSGAKGGKKADQVAAVRELLPKGKAGQLAAKNPWAIRAGEELWYTHKVGKATRTALGRMGLNIGYDPEIFSSVSGR